MIVSYFDEKYYYVSFRNLKEHMRTGKAQLLHALKDESGDLCDILKISVQYGIAYHHSGMIFINIYLTCKIMKVGHKDFAL